ncbi:NAD(P)-dependent oxidoreductase [Sediminivirga luteola]|jgi:phosphoglycerate dehydrogenase-like enzyme|uniref:Oxidoreductase n=1 Tax=Sediminivirga luteola TaxID=1774748 RepID=A0A8J2XJC5_9MICO|nr:NAD(P)-dependent oxidoreductase [Sediminivirga luteola]GGA19526.1 oxidoreductase [Sediminivirga luteola]
MTAGPGRVLVTPRSLTSQGLDAVPELAPLRAAGYELVSGPAGQAPGRDQLEALLPGVVGWLAGVERIDGALLRAHPQLRAISRNGIGTNAIDLAAAEECGISVLTARGANAQGVAELALLQMLTALRGHLEGMAALRAGGWSRSPGAELNGKTVGVIGMGAIGARVARIAAAFGAAVVAHDPVLTSHQDAELLPLEELAARADVITLHCPPRERPLIDAAFLARCRPGLILINTAREGLVDAAALLAALDGGQVAAYAVDAFDVEPPPASALLRHPRVLPTPHLGGYTSESVSRATSAAVGNLLAALRGS